MSRSHTSAWGLQLRAREAAPGLLAKLQSKHNDVPWSMVPMSSTLDAFSGPHKRRRQFHETFFGRIVKLRAVSMDKKTRRRAEAGRGSVPVIRASCHQPSSRDASTVIVDVCGVFHPHRNPSSTSVNHATYIHPGPLLRLLRLHDRARP